MTITVDPPKSSLPSRRPAETAGVGLGAAAVIAYVLGVSAETATIILGAASLAPAVVTWLVSRDLPGRPWRWLVAAGGIRGVARMFWAGRG